jgi:hypothetical protein
MERVKLVIANVVIAVVQTISYRGVSVNYKKNDLELDYLQGEKLKDVIAKDILYGHSNRNLTDEDGCTLTRAT